MGDAVFYALEGIGVGALYALLAVGIVIVYRGSGVVNFAHGAFATYGVLTFDEARRSGRLRLPWVDVLPTHRLDLPVTIRLASRGLSTPAAVAVALVMAAALGLVAHLLVFRPLRDAAPLAKVVASVGVMLYLQGVAQRNFGDVRRVAHDIVPLGDLRNFLGLGHAFPIASLWLAALAVAAGAILWALFRFTRAGLAARAAASSEKGAVLLGYSPNALAAGSWALACVVATVGAIGVGSLREVGALANGTLTSLALSGTVVAGLGAALVGGMRSIPVATAGGLAMGAAQSLLGYGATRPWFPGLLRSGAREIVPFAVVAVALALRGASLQGRGTVEEKRLPTSPRPVRATGHALVWSAVVVVAAFAFSGGGSLSLFAFGLSTSLVASLVMLSMVVVTGYVGQISLVQMSLAGVAAFVVARLLADGRPLPSSPYALDGPGLPWALAALVAVAAAVAVGVLAGLPAVRIRGVQLAVATVALAVALQPVYFDNPRLSGADASGLARVRAPRLFGIDFAARGAGGLSDRPAFTILALAVLVACAAGVSNLRRNGTGRRFLAVRANDRAAAAAGIDVPRTKLLAFALGSAIAGLGGVLLAVKEREVSAANFISQASLTYLAFACIGGITSVNGAVVGGLLAPSALVTVTVNRLLAGTSIDRYVTIVGGAALVVVAVVSPGGLAPAGQRMLGWGWGWVRARGGHRGGRRRASSGPLGRTP